MEFPAHWSLPVIKTELLHVKHCETDIPPGLTQTVKLHESAQQDGELVTRIKLESTEVQQVETCNATTPSLVVVKREPSDLGIEAGIAAVTQQEDGMELAVHKGSCIKAEPPESTSAQQQTENLSNDSFDDVPVISGEYMQTCISINQYICEQVLFGHVFTAIPPQLSEPCNFITVLLVTWEPEQTTLLFWSTVCSVMPHDLHTADQR